MSFFSRSLTRAFSSTPLALHPGYLGSQDTYFVGTMKGVDRIYQQTFVDTYSRVALAKLYIEKTAITAAPQPETSDSEYDLTMPA